MRKLILTACLLTLTAASADAGPLRRIAGAVFGGRGGCSGCQTSATAVTVPWSPYQQTVVIGDQVRSTPVVMPQTNTVHLVSYQRGADAGPVAQPGYTPIPLGGGLLPTRCVGPNCR